MKIEVIMAAYNNVRDMKLVLEGYRTQIDSDFSICIADDGSRPAVASLVTVYKELGLNIRHIWQEDKGFRRGEILNKAIASSVAEYIILTDNDCIPSKFFISDYRESFTPETFILGRRIDLNELVSNKIRKNKISISVLDSTIWLLLNFVVGNLKRPARGMRLPLFVCKLWSKKGGGALGANMGVEKRALLKVNGFDNDFQGYGAEESDLEWRLKAIGLNGKLILGRCCLYHLFHPVKVAGSEARELYLSKKRSGIIKCLNGISRQSKPKAD